MTVAAPTMNGTHTLSSQHRADLQKSGLSDEQIERCGFYSIRDANTIQGCLNWQSFNLDLGACLAIPFMTSDGKPARYVRLKPDRPRTQKDNVTGKSRLVKYESPKGKANLAYFPPNTRDVLADPSQPLIITEGEKKAAKADQDGFPCIGLTGVYGWHKRKKSKDAEREMIDGLAAVAWQGRQVYVCYDSDAATNKHVLTAEWHLAEALTARGAIVRIVRLPQGEPAEDGSTPKVGLDDYLVTAGPDAFRELLAAAVEPMQPEREVKPVELPDDPHRLARLVADRHHKGSEGLTLRYWREEFVRWDGLAYRVVPEKELRAEVTADVKEEMDRVNIVAQKLATGDGPSPVAHKVTSRLVSDVIHALASMTMLPSRTESPSWLADADPFPASEVLACRNELVHLPSLVAVSRNYSLPPTPRFFSTNCLDFDFDMSAPPPTAWLEFLASLWKDQPQSIAALQEFFGYCLTADTTQEKILLVVGPKRSGKGTIARVLRGLVGADNVACPTLSSLAMNFGLWPLIGKTVAMIQDARLSGRTDIAAIVERLLSISGNDPQTIDRKNLSQVTTKLLCRFVVMTNELPKFNDPSGALPGRMIVLQLTESWYGKENTRLTEELLTELPSILLWAIAGWKRLHQRGRFEQPQESQDLVEELEDLVAPIRAFLKERCFYGPSLQVERDTLFGAWKAWCDEQGREHPGDKGTFGRNLRAAVPRLKTAQPRHEGDRTAVKTANATKKIGDSGLGGDDDGSLDDLLGQADTSQGVVMSHAQREAQLDPEVMSRLTRGLWRPKSNAVIRMSVLGKVKKLMARTRRHRLSQPDATDLVEVQYKDGSMSRFSPLQGGLYKLFDISGRVPPLPRGVQENILAAIADGEAEGMVDDYRWRTIGDWAAVDTTGNIAAMRRKGATASESSAGPAPGAGPAVQLSHVRRPLNRDAQHAMSRLTQGKAYWRAGNFIHSLAPQRHLRDR